ncbi:hypothetical protein GCM10023263_95130 [Phytohabitans rumicis]
MCSCTYAAAATYPASNGCAGEQQPTAWEESRAKQCDGTVRLVVGQPQEYGCHQDGGRSADVDDRATDAHLVPTSADLSAASTTDCFAPSSARSDLRG